ncbi:MAG: NCS2 family permease, partial [Oscillospiraceae bacterium]
TQLPQSITLSGISLAPVFLQADFGGLLSLGVLPLVTAVITFTMCLCFDSLGSVICVAGAGGLLSKDGSLGKYSRGMTVSAVGTCLSSLLGGPALIPPVEGSTGLADGARTPLHAIGTGVCFLLAIFVAPIAGMIPSAATAPSLILIGMLMIGNATNIYWHNLEIALPCFLTMVMIPFTYSVPDGIGIGMISYVIICLITGKGKKVPLITYGLAAMFIIMYILSAL